MTRACRAHRWARVDGAGDPTLQRCACGLFRRIRDAALEFAWRAAPDAFWWSEDPAPPCPVGPLAE